ncbi:hypothetical protein LTR85_008198 [Meristemomyces frigidus]|nr:hypothetical protein LTR85_008198 [Meristemomyces frigidus]
MQYKFAAAAAIAGAGPSDAELPMLHDNVALSKRQMNANSTCQVFGIDFQNGGSYFLNINSTTDFMAVSQFQSCNNDTASILLVNDDTGDQYDCNSVPTVPDGVSQAPTCPIEKSQLVSGNYSLLTIGNNGNGNPFAYQRDFNLTVGQQQTAMVTVTKPYTLSIQSTSTATSTSVITTTASLHNSADTTEDFTCFQTVTPPTTRTTQTDVILRTFTRWTTTETTSTSVVTASCTVPPRPDFPDKWCRITPTGISLPEGLKIQGRSAHMNHLQKRDVDVATVTSTVTVASGSTVTITADPTSITTTLRTTDTVYTTLPTSTVSSIESDTITASAPAAQTVKGHQYSVTYVTETMSVVFTSGTTTTPASSATACMSAGGHFDDA